VLANSTTGETKLDTTPIISAFVANFDFIPKHRRLSLFRALLEALGLERHLPFALLLLAEKSAQTTEKTKNSVTEFALDLTNSFSLPERLSVRSLYEGLIVGCGNVFEFGVDDPERTD
jgi:hypothetical protein